MKSKFLTLITIVMVGIALLLSGCDKTTKPAKNNDKNGAPSATTSASKKADKESKKVVLYRTAADGSQILLPETKELQLDKKNPSLTILKALIETKPQDSKMQNIFPEGTKVLGVEIKNDVAEVNLSKEFLTKGVGDYTQVMMVNSLVNTLTENPSIKKVRILAEGKAVEVLGQLDLSDALVRNESFLEKKK